MIYFDNAATTFPKPEVVYKKMNDFYRSNGVNAGRGTYSTGVEACNIIEDTRKRLHNILKLDTNNVVVFSPSATVAINTIIKGLDYKQGDIIYYSPFEHNAVLRSLYYVRELYKIKLKQIPVDPNSLEFDLTELKLRYLEAPPKLVVVSHVSNVCGLIAPIEDITSLTHKFNGKVLVDGAQAAGLVNANLKKIDYYVWTAHKSLYGPFGIAGFVINRSSPTPSPLIHGGTGSESELETMPDKIPVKYEGGSINIQAVAGLNASLRWLENKGTQNIYTHERKLTSQLISMLEDFIDINLFKPMNLDNHFNVVSASFSGYKPDEVGKILSEKYDIAVRTGLHCSPEVHRFLGTIPNGLVRFSIGYFNTQDDIIQLKNALDSFII